MAGDKGCVVDPFSGELTQECVIIPFPVPEMVVDVKTCHECEYGYIGAGGIHCIELNEMIIDDTVANDCSLYSGFEEE